MIWGKNKALLKKPVLIDGITRSGKSILSGIISSLKNSENIKFLTYFEHIIPGLSFKDISRDYAKNQLRLLLNELAYSTFLGRDANLRLLEQTSLKNPPHNKIYSRRLQSKEGDRIIQSLLKTKNFFPFQTHELMTNINHVNSLDINHKIIEIYRNPIDIIYSWINLDWGKRFINDPRSFTLTRFNNKYKTNVPWFVSNYSNIWVSLNKYERSAYAVCDLIERSVKNQKKNKLKSKILTISFENFYQNPDKNLIKICKFLNTKKTKYTDNEIRKARCPRIDNIEKRHEKEKFIEKKVSKKIFKHIEKLRLNYEKDLYGL
jgi:hypothetical protein